MISIRTSRRKALLAAAVGVVFAGNSLMMSAPSVAAPANVAQAGAGCSDVELVFARGTGELQGPSILQHGTLSALKGGLPGKSVSNYSVVYPAGFNQNAKPGQVDMVRRVTETAAKCPNTKFVLGGYSQGATVVDMSIGVNLFGKAPGAIPANLEPKIAAIVTYGNPLGKNRLAAASPTYADRIIEFCASGDPVCRDGVNGMAHVAYITNGDTTKGGKFAAQKVLASSGKSTSKAPAASGGSSPAVKTATAPKATTASKTGSEGKWWCSWVPFLCGGAPAN